MTLKNGLQKRKNYGIWAFLLGIILAAFVVVPIMIHNNGYFLYYGDFNVQQIPFYRLAHDSIRAGNMGWSHLTDLGANFVGSYSFYLLGSPFFWLTIPLKSEWVAYSIGPLLILKLGFCSLTAYIYLRRYVRDRRWAVLGGLLYAFSGFSVFDIFFFHFHEAMIIFPLLLAAMDAFHYERRRGLVALCVCASALMNYYFFFGQVIFCVIYYIVKLCCRSYKVRLSDFFLLIGESVIGLLASCVLLLPSIAAIMGNYRVSQLNLGWHGLLYDKAQKYVQIFISFFFPADLPARANFTPDSDAKWASVAAYIPMFSMTYAAAYINQYKKSVARRIFIVLAVMAFVPILNSMFQAFNAAYYARWFYMLTVMLALMTVRSLDDIREANFKKSFIFTVGVTLGVAIVIGLMPYKAYSDSTSTVYKFGLEKSPFRFWAFVAISVGGLILTLLGYIIYRKKPRFFFRFTAITLCLFCVGYTELYLILGKMQTDYSLTFMQERALSYGKDIDLPDLDSVRSEPFQTMDNIGMYWQIPNIQAFHSIVPGSVMEYYRSIGVRRDVGSRPEAKYYGTRALTSVKYVFDDADKKKFVSGGKTQMPGYTYIDTQNHFNIYENDYYIPMGFTYDKYICKEEFQDLSENVRHLALLKAMVLTQEQMEKYRDITGYTDGMYLDLNMQTDDGVSQDKAYPEYNGFESLTSSFRYSESAYFKDCERLRKHTCTDFAYNNSGFTAKYDNTEGKDNLLFFSVPYDSGWSATLNGEPAEIEKVNIGFMAVKIDKGKTYDISFTYHTPLFKEGLIVTIAGAGILIVYLILCMFFSKKRDKRHKYRMIIQNTEGTT